eukprot:15357-Chlamydomonas_euryale.AAC.2
MAETSCASFQAGGQWTMALVPFLHLVVVEVGYERVNSVWFILLVEAELSRVVSSRTHTTAFCWKP